MQKKRETCPDCGSPLTGKPWEVRHCTGCPVWMPPRYLHPDAPEKVKTEGRMKLAPVIRSLAGVAS